MPCHRRHRHWKKDCDKKPVIVELTDDFANSVQVITLPDGTKEYKNINPDGKAPVFLLDRPFPSGDATVIPVKFNPDFTPSPFIRFTEANNAVTATTGEGENGVETSAFSGITFILEENQSGRFVVLLENTPAAKFVDNSSLSRSLLTTIATGDGANAAQVGFGVAERALDAQKVRFGRHLRFFRNLGTPVFAFPAPFSTEGTNGMVPFVMTWHRIEEAAADNGCC